MQSSFNTEQVTNDVTYLTDWKRCDDISLCQYRYLLDAELSKVELSKELLDLQYSTALHEDTPDSHVQYVIDDYYNSIMACIKYACSYTLPSK